MKISGKLFSEARKEIEIKIAKEDEDSILAKNRYIIEKTWSARDPY